MKSLELEPRHHRGGDSIDHPELDTELPGFRPVRPGISTWDRHQITNAFNSWGS